MMAFVGPDRYIDATRNSRGGNLCMSSPLGRCVVVKHRFYFLIDKTQWRDGGKMVVKSR